MSQETPPPAEETHEQSGSVDPVLGVDVDEIVRFARELAEVANLDGLEALQAAVNWKVQDREEARAEAAEWQEKLDREELERFAAEHLTQRIPPRPTAGHEHAVADGMRIVPVSPIPF